MKRLILAALSLAFLSLAVVPVIPSDANLSTKDGVKKFFDKQQLDSN